ncbi:hypothetical protein RN22_04945 [Grimontia sp. AD028]|uniref:Uncharacterized protein n=1 Tax=Grimontia sedimenti TaxID=2711294 RepID=A0A6M1RAJ9_9GAMM|nr:MULTISPECIES: hypothetical protein [Grimontia]KKD61580.1 hypothetical protein RN22_04945 [Grimontia sp. AD028]NGN96452.1 hypothetical protein [Grimontia sedimenti]
MTTFALGRKTIINESSLEYDWIRRQVEEGTERSEIIGSILRCFGGDEEIAELFYSIALGESSPGILLTHLSLCDWSPTPDLEHERLEKI